MARKQDITAKDAEDSLRPPKNWLAARDRAKLNRRLKPILAAEEKKRADKSCYTRLGVLMIARLACYLYAEPIDGNEPLFIKLTEAFEPRDPVMVESLARFLGGELLNSGRAMVQFKKVLPNLEKGVLVVWQEDECSTEQAPTLPKNV